MDLVLWLSVCWGGGGGGGPKSANVIDIHVTTTLDPTQLTEHVNPIITNHSTNWTYNIIHIIYNIYTTYNTSSIWLTLQYILSVPSTMDFAAHFVSLSLITSAPVVVLMTSPYWKITGHVVAVSQQSRRGSKLVWRVYFHAYHWCFLWTIELL